jgi:hypothetical protein
MLLVVIAALCVALAVQPHRAARREVELQARLTPLQTEVAHLQAGCLQLRAQLARSRPTEATASGKSFGYDLEHGTPMPAP